MKKLALVLASTALLAGCGVNPNEAAAALEAQGLTNVKLGGYSLFGCSERDTFRSKFEAIGANGKPVSGVVCSGLLKGVTVRFTF